MVRHTYTDEPYVGYTWEPRMKCGMPDPHWVKYLRVTTPSGVKVDTNIKNRWATYKQEREWMDRHMAGELTGHDFCIMYDQSHESGQKMKDEWRERRLSLIKEQQQESE